MATKLRVLFWLGMILLFLPFIGIPATWKMILTILIGLCILRYSFIIREEYKRIRTLLRQYEQQ